MNRALLVLAALCLLAGCSGTRSGIDTEPEDFPTLTLFDGTSLDGWQMTGPGAFVLDEDGTMYSTGGMGLLYYGEQKFRDFVLELEYQTNADTANSGIFVRFPDLPPDPWVPVNTGYEIQIDDRQDPIHQTGAIYSFSAPFRLAAKPPGQWNQYRIEVTGQRYQIFLNGEKVNDFFGDRGREGYIGLQNHDDASRVRYRNIRVKPLPAGDYPESLAEHFATSGRAPIRVLMLTATHGWRHGDAIETAKTLMAELSETTEFEVDHTENLAMLHPDSLARYDLLFLANTTLRAEQAEETEEAEAPLAPALSGSWRTYQLTLSVPGNELPTLLALDGAPESLRGQIQVGDGPPAPLADVIFNEDGLRFHYDAGQYGLMSVEATLDGEVFEGTMQGAGGGPPMPLAGRIAGSDAASNGGMEEQQEVERVTQAQQQAMLDFLRAGKGIVGAHAALDALYAWDGYRELVGRGLFEEHPWVQSVRVMVEEAANPATAHLDHGFWIRDEIYVLDENPRWNSRVLASLDMTSVEAENPAGTAPNDHPIAWIRNHNGGRVFMTTLGHFPDVWTTPAYVQMLLEGMRMAAGRVPADFSGRRVKEVIAENVWPDDIAVDTRGNVWIAELRGKVHHFDAGTGDVRQIAHLQTTDPTKIEHGLYGIEVDPNFYDGEPYVYLFYAEPETFINTLSRFDYRDGQIDIASEKVILRVPTEPQCCHQAGDLEWGPDGTLYVSTGDTGMSETRPDWELSEEEIAAFQAQHGLKDYHWSRLVDSERTAQNLQDLRGKILRINKDGTIPKDNPFYGEPGVRWEIYAYGLRNPYRFKVDPETSALYIGVVGPDASFDYDEYNISEKGGENFGWPRTLGRLFYNEWTPEMIPGYVPPLWEYTYETGGRSATVGPIYRHDGPGAFPKHFQDKVFLYDWSRRWVKYATVVPRTFTNDTGADVREPPLSVEMPALRFTEIKTFDTLRRTAPISMELSPDGSLYLAEFDGFWDAGPRARVTRYRWIEGNEEPIGEATFEAVPGQPRTIRFDGRRSYDPNVDAITFRWDFGDGTTSTEAAPTHTYAAPGSYTARLTVTDAHGATSTPLVLAVSVETSEATAASSDGR